MRSNHNIYEKKPHAIIILLGVEDHPHCTNCSKILWTTFYPFGIEVLFFQYFEHCGQVRISKTIWESTIVYFIISGNASKEIPQKTYFFPILFSFFDKLSIIEQAELILVMVCILKRWARAEHELDPNTSLNQTRAWPKHEFDPSTSLTQVKRSKPSMGSVSIEYYTSLYTYYLGSWYSSWYSVVSIHLHQKYVYITVL